MAKIFIAYNTDDRTIVREIESRLEEIGHESVWRVDELVAGKGWGELMPQRLSMADAVIAILTKNSHDDKSVWCEVGAARVLAHSEKKTAFLPVIIDLEYAPGYTGDILKLWEKNCEEDDSGSRIPKLCEEIDRAIGAHVKAIISDNERSQYPRIFISHRHVDSAIAQELVNVLRCYFKLDDNDIRCTSVQPYRLPFGKNTGERLRSEIGATQVVLGLLAPDTRESTYVMFELGAAWSQGTYTCPLLCRDAGIDNIPGPIFDLAPARLSKLSDCNQLLVDLENELSFEKANPNAAELQVRIQALCDVAAEQ